MPQLSIVASMFQSEKYIPEFYQRSLASLKRLGIKDYEIILVDDGSPDDSLRVARDLVADDANVSVIELSRNFGHHKAMITGLEAARGDRIFLIDIDLEEAPELLEGFWSKMESSEKNTIDVVFGVQKKRKGRWFERISGSLFYKVFNAMSDEAKLQPNCLTVRLMTRSYVEALTSFKFREFYFAPVCSLVGFRQLPYLVKKTDASPTTYSFSIKYNMLISTLFYFSTKPLYFIFYLGVFITLISFSMGVYVLAVKTFRGIAVGGWSSLILSIWFLGGVIISFLGVQAIYLSKLFSETKREPFTIIRNTYRSQYSKSK